MPARLETPLSTLLRSAAAAVVAAALLAAPVPAFATRAPSDSVGGVTLASRKVPASVAPDITARAGIVVATDGRVVWARDAHARVPMASTTKMMTALLAIESGHLDRVVTVSAAASRVPYGLGLRPGERFTKRQLLQLALVASSNDAAYALGEATAGDMATFVRRMNERAAALGLRDTRYANPHGLDAPGHYSSAADLATLARAAMKLPDFRRTVAMRSVPLHGATLKSTDKLLGAYRGMEGVKTGMTNDAGYCFVGMAKRGHTELTAVVLGAGPGDARFAQASRLLDWGFAHLSRRVLASRGAILGSVPVSGSASANVPVRFDASASAVAVAGVAVERRASLPARVAFPVFAGQRLGEVAFVQGDTVLARVPLVAATSVVSAEETVGSVPVSDYVDGAVAAVTASGVPSPAFDAAKPVTHRVDLAPALTAPVRAGDRIGEVVYVQGERTVVRVPVLAATDVPVPSLAERVHIALTRGWLAVIGAPTFAPLRVTEP